VRTVY